MSPFFVKPLIVDREPLIEVKDTPIATSFALIVDRETPIVDKKPLIARATMRSYNQLQPKIKKPQNKKPLPNGSGFYYSVTTFIHCVCNFVGIIDSPNPN